MAASEQRPAAVDGKFLPRDEIRLARGEKDDGVGDVFRLAEMGHGRLREIAFLCLLGSIGMALDQDPARRDEIDGNAFRRELSRPGARHRA